MTWLLSHALVDMSVNRRTHFNGGNSSWFELLVPLDEVGEYKSGTLTLNPRHAAVRVRRKASCILGCENEFRILHSFGR